MARENPDYRQMCPFWSMQAMKCQLCRDGLFIPLNDHIEAYCQTLHYPACLQYSLHSASHLQLREKNTQNRRKYDRVAASHPVIVETKEMAAHLSAALESATQGRTLDLSKGGMRLTIEQPLVKTTLIRFFFENSFPKSVQTGEGQIAWCNKRTNEPGFQAGISFQDDQLIDTMGLYLGLITSTPPSR